MHSYEIEIKCLLGSKQNADQLRSRMIKVDPKVKLVAKNKQLNHYFIGGDINILYKNAAPLFPKEEKRRLEKIVEEGSNFSIRTRLLNETLLLVIKASIDDMTSANGISRIEFESEIKNMTLEGLDQLLLNAGFDYQAKWSREREEYTCKGINVCLDKNAGYGYLAEFERVIDDASHAEEVQKELRKLMSELKVNELPQDRLSRMFDYYNENWLDYYGTNKIFVVK